MQDSTPGRSEGLNDRALRGGATLLIAAALIPAAPVLAQVGAGSAQTTAAPATEPQAATPAPASPEGAPPAPTATPFPDGFLGVKLESTADEVRRAVPKTSEAFEMHDVQGCPTAPAQPCLRIVERAPKDTGATYSKAEYGFNPFNGRLARITVEYRLPYLDVDSQFTRSFGPPSVTLDKSVSQSAFLGAGREVTKVWKQGAVEVELVYLLVGKKATEAHTGHVEFRSLTQLELMRDLAAKLKDLGPNPGAPAPAQAPGAPASPEPKKDDAPPKLF